MPAPTVTSITPNLANIAGGVAATITGTNLTGATGVTIGGVAATSVIVVGSTSITCILPAGSAGGSSVLVTTPDGTNGANTLLTYIPATPTDIYVYLSGGRGDGFVPEWTGAFNDVTRSVKSDPYRNIFRSTRINRDTFVSAAGGGIELPLTGVTDAYFTAGVAATAVPGLVVGALGGVATATGAIAKMSDEVAGADPRQFVREVTHREYTSANGLVYAFDLSKIVGIGGAARG